MRTIVLALLLASLAASLPVIAAPPQATPVNQTEITPPAAIAVHAHPNSVVLRGGSHSANVKTLTVKRQFDVSQLRANPVILLGRTKVNLAPVFNNPTALHNIATRLRAMPQLAEVMTNDMQALEVSQGLVLHHFISYRLKPGTCSDPARRSDVESSGVRCATQLTEETRAAAFARKGDPHYVAEPRRRALAVADAEKKAKALRVQFTAHVAQLRAALSTPAGRAQIDTQRGTGESARLAALNDDQIKAEVINSGVTKIEQVMFVRSADKLDEVKTVKQLVKRIKLTPSVAGLGLIQAAPAPAPTPDAVTDTPIDTYIFLTGFTLGRDYEWSQRVEKTVSWPIFGDETYYAEAHAGFNYGLGLRFPIRLSGTYHYRNTAAGETASVTTDFIPFKGTPEDFIAAGLDPAKLFDGQEFVAQFGAHAGASYSLPTLAMALVGLPGSASLPPTNDSCGAPENELCVGYDFAAKLTGDFANGKFTPPAPGQPGPTLENTFTDFDLIGGLANFGIIGAQVFPAVKAELHSSSLTFTLRDNVNGADHTLNYSPTSLKTDLGIGPNHLSDFSIGDPVYNLGFTVTPGIDARVFIDIEVWGDHWDWPIWFPQLAIELPPGGVQFSCHEGTICTREYKASPTVSHSGPGTQAGFDTDVDNWSKDFDAQWLPQCVDDTCKVGVRLVRIAAVLNAQQQHDSQPSLTVSHLPVLDEAVAQARVLIQEAQRRQSATELEADANLAVAMWSSKCSDKLCFDNVAAITHHEQVDVGVRHTLAPDESILGLFGKVSKEYGNKQLQAEIDASTVRATAATRPPRRMP